MLTTHRQDRRVVWPVCQVMRGWGLFVGVLVGACQVSPEPGDSGLRPDDGAPADGGVPADDGATTQPSPPATDDGEASTGDGALPVTDEGSGDDSTGAGVVLDVGTMPDLPAVRPDCESAIDIVFVVDVSTTMDTVLTHLADEIAAVDAALAAYDLETQPQYGLAVFVDDAAILGEGEPFADIPALQQEFEYWAGWTSQGTQLAPSGFLNFTWAENSLDALYLAATEYGWRDADSTLRIVIHATDDTFWDGPTQQNGVAIVHGYGETVEALQQEQIRVYSFSAEIGGMCECEDVTAGWSAPYMGMASIPDATDGGTYDVEAIVDATVSFTDAIAEAVEQSYCTEYEPAG